MVSAVGRGGLEAWEVGVAESRKSASPENRKRRARKSNKANKDPGSSSSSYPPSGDSEAQLGLRFTA